MNEDTTHMTRALELAARGEGLVEPNPMVGCVLVRDGRRIGEGWHQRFGGPHAEIDALMSVDGSPSGATMYVTLEPCCHTGKTPPCTSAVIDAGIRRVVVAQLDPFPAVGGRGVEQLRAAGIRVEVGLLQEAADQLIAPFRKLVERRLPWVIAKWAMTLDGKLASRTGHSRWISNESSRQRVHMLRQRVDAIVIGSRTAALDDPLLTARPPGARRPVRIVVDSNASLSLQSRLVETAREQAVLVAVSETGDDARCRELERAGCEVFRCDGSDPTERLRSLFAELGRRQMTNVLAEGGGALLGSLFDLQYVDEVHVFIAPKLVGGDTAPTPLGGRGLDQIPTLSSLVDPRIEVLEQDIYITGRLRREVGP